MADKCEEQKDTPRVCEACGGSRDEECRWCAGGFQSVAQQADWRHFRLRVSHISGTYSMAQRMAQELVELLRARSDPDAQRLAHDGNEALTRWILSEPGSPEREEANRVLMKFHIDALNLLVPRK